MARSNPTWCEERIAAELIVKLGIRVSPRTVRRYMARETGGGRRGTAGQWWATFVRNHAHAIVACDFCVAVTATFRVLHIFVALEVGSRRLVPCMQALTAPNFLLTTATARRIFGMRCQGADLVGPERGLLQGPGKSCPARRPEKPLSL